MEKKELGVGQYVSTGTLFVKSRISPEVTKMSLTDHAKAAVLEYLTESDEFHKLVCDITGVERKQTKVSPELEKLKEDYSHMCESYEHEKQQRNDLIRKWREETAKRLDAERERDCAQRHHKFVMDELSSMLKEVECISVRGVVDSLKAERANEKMLAEDNELCRRENDRLKQSYEKANKGLQTLHLNHILKLRKELEAQKDLVKKYVAKSEKLQSKLDKASKQYGELIKIINDRAIKSI
jgi:F0F1-type ATP synthase membrane subunit b/b'